MSMMVMVMFMMSPLLMSMTRVVLVTMGMNPVLERRTGHDCKDVILRMSVAIKNLGQAADAEIVVSALNRGTRQYVSYFSCARRYSLHLCTSG